MPEQTATPRLATLLLAIDGSDFGDGAVRVTTGLAITNESTVVVLSVLANNQSNGMMGLDTRAVEEERRWAVVRRVVAGIEAAGVRVRGMVSDEPNVAAAVVATAGNVHADMIVVGRRARRGLVRTRRGETLARIIADADCPVLVVPRAGELWRRRILMATDGSTASEVAGSIAGLCALGHHMPVTVLSVENPKHSAERQAEARGIVDEAVRKLVAGGVDASGWVRRGAPADEIIAAVGDVGADLIVMGSAGRSGLGRMMVGSNSQAVITNTTCPVLVTTARMVERQAQRFPPETVPAAPALTESDRPGFLVVADGAGGTAALDYACQQARAVDGRVEIVRIVAGGESEADGRQILDALAARAVVLMGETAPLHLAHGDPATVIIDLIVADPSISGAVMTAGPGDSGQNIADLITRRGGDLTVPLTIVPARPRI